MPNTMMDNDTKTDREIILMKRIDLLVSNIKKNPYDPSDYDFYYQSFDKFIKESPINLNVTVEYPDHKPLGLDYITPLITAIDNDLHPIIRCLIDNGADITLASGSCSPLERAISKNNKSLVAEFAAAGVPITEGHLSLAYINDKLDMMELLIRLGAPVTLNNVLKGTVILFQVSKMLEAAYQAEKCLKRPTLDKLIDVSKDELASANLLARAKKEDLTLSKELIEVLAEEGHLSTNEVVTSMCKIVKSQLMNALEIKLEETKQIEGLLSHFVDVTLETHNDLATTQTADQQRECLGSPSTEGNDLG